MAQTDVGRGIAPAAMVQRIDTLQRVRNAETHY